jgi:hypothetical protein
LTLVREGVDEKKSLVVKDKWEEWRSGVEILVGPDSKLDRIEE